MSVVVQDQSIFHAAFVVHHFVVLFVFWCSSPPFSLPQNHVGGIVQGLHLRAGFENGFVFLWEKKSVAE